jgi:hypothetical protein
MIQTTLFYDELEQGFDHFPRYHTKILLVDFNAKLGREDIFKRTNGNESLRMIVMIIVLE